MQKLSVPLFKQGKLECGPTALKMVLHYFDKEVSSNEIIKKTDGIKKYGVKTIKLADFAEKLGFRVYCYSYNKKLSKGKAEIRKPAKSDIIRFTGSMSKCNTVGLAASAVRYRGYAKDLPPPHEGRT